METVVIKRGWHKVSDKIAMTYTQLEYIYELKTDENCPCFPFNSSTNAMRSLTKMDASEIIDALKRGDKVIFE